MSMCAHPELPRAHDTTGAHHHLLVFTSVRTGGPSARQSRAGGSDVTSGTAGTRGWAAGCPCRRRSERAAKPRCRTRTAAWSSLICVCTFSRRKRSELNDDDGLVVNPPTPCQIGKHPPAPNNPAGQQGAHGGRAYAVRPGRGFSAGGGGAGPGLPLPSSGGGSGGGRGSGPSGSHPRDRSSAVTGNRRHNNTRE